MRILSRAVLREVISSSVLGAILFTFVLFLQRVSKLFEILVRASAPTLTVGQLFALAIPFTFSFTIPLGVLVGVLIALSRMSADGEITAMRAAGLSSRTVVAPVMTFAAFAMLLTATATLWLTPYSVWKTYKILNQLLAAELTADVQPRVFAEQFPNKVLYVGDVIPGAVTRWRNVFLADLSPPQERSKDGKERGDAPRITVATGAIAVPDVSRNLIELSMLNVSTHEPEKDITQYINTSSPRQTQILQASRPGEVHARSYVEMDTVPLYRVAYHESKLDRDSVIQARIEFQHRIALPFACVLLALLGIPLGISTRKGGKSTAFVLTALLAFLYWMGLIAMDGLAKQQRLPVAVAIWTPNAVFAIIGLLLIVRLERPGNQDWVGIVQGWLAALFDRVRGRLRSAQDGAGVPAVRAFRRFPLLPQVVDRYVLSSFLFYFVLLLASFVMMTHVYTFFELLSDIVRNKIPMARVLTYLFYLTPKLIYDSTPVSVLVAVLITFGILTKHNEITAFKACGVSLYRLSVPLFGAAALLSGSLFLFDHYYVPEANRKQDAIRNEIKGRPAQTYLDPGQKWIMGDDGSRIYFYKYMDPADKAMAGVNVYELDPVHFRLLRHISAERAHWEPALRAWVFENGWSRDLTPGHEQFHNFMRQTATFSELTERPDWFLKEVLQDKQMNYKQLAAYIRELQQSGFDTIALRVQFYRKFSVPLFALIMAIISTPFAFLAGNRGAMAGVGISFGIAIAYWASNSIFEQLGNVALLPAAAAAWAPDAIFALAGMYFFTRLRT